jgi:hypothetical protein
MTAGGYEAPEHECSSPEDAGPEVDVMIEGEENAMTADPPSPSKHAIHHNSGGLVL